MKPSKSARGIRDIRMNSGLRFELAVRDEFNERESGIRPTRDLVVLRCRRIISWNGMLAQ